MIRVAPVQRCLQSKLILEKPGDNLDDEHIAKLIVYLINDFEKKKPYLFHERNVDGKIGPKFQNELKELFHRAVREAKSINWGNMIRKVKN